MKFKKLVSSVAGVLLAQGLMVGSAQAVPYGFECISNNIAGDCAIGEAQLSVDVTASGATRVSFKFSNSGPSLSSITDVYFDFGSLPDYLTTIASITGSAGVSFSEGASPPNLPSGNTVAFTADVAADSNSPTQPNGVNPGEWLEIIFNLANNATLQDVLDELNGSAPQWLRIGIHVQGFATGGSEAFVNTGSRETPVPEPGALALLGLALGGLGLIKRRRRN